MMRTVVVLGLASLPVAVARADVACATEARAVTNAGDDPALAPPTDAAAMRHRTEGNRRHREGLKLARVLKQDEAAVAYGAAVEAYIAAALADAAPSLLYNLGQTYRAAGDYDKAIRQYRLFLDRGQPRAALRRLVECHIANMTAELERAASTAPPSEPAPDPAEPSGGAVAPAAAPSISPRLDTPPARVAPWYADGLGWGLTGTGVAGMAVGALLLGDAASLRDAADREVRDDVRLDLRARAETRQTWGSATALVGGAVLIVGVIRLMSQPEAPRAPTPAAALHVGPSGVAIVGRF